MSNRLYLAQINIGRLKYGRDDNRIAGWRDNIDRINELAERSDGFVWRLSGSDGQYTGSRMFDDDRIVTNMSVWRSPTALARFVYRSAHVEFIRGRRSWFEMVNGHQALWWVPAKHRPTLEEGKKRLVLIRKNGPTSFAFDFRNFFNPDGQRLDRAGWDE